MTESRESVTSRPFDRYNLMMTVEAGDDPVHPDQAYKIAHALLRKCLAEIDRLTEQNSYLTNAVMLLQMGPGDV
jgi:hypothetical protein